MMKVQSVCYPGVEDAIRLSNDVIRIKRMQTVVEDAPDFLGSSPNYDKFVDKDPESVLVWLNID